MSCLNFVKQLRKIGRIFGNMTAKIKPHHASYKLPFLDSEIDNTTGSFHYSLPLSSSGYVSPEISEPSSITSFFDQNNAENSPNYFDSFHIDDHIITSSDVKQSPFTEDSIINSIFDVNSIHFGIFDQFVQSSRGFSDCSIFSYSPLSNSTLSYESSYNDLLSSDMFAFRMQQECIRKEFEMNGKTIDDPPQDDYFQPLHVSTPLNERKFDQYTINDQQRNSSKLANGKNLEILDKSKKSDTVQLENLYWPALSKPANQLKNDSQSRKRSKQPVIVQNQLHFEKSSKKSVAKKSNSKKKLEDFCVFCKNNGVDEVIYRSHTVKDSKGRVLCPKLRAYQCPICGEDGDNSHTIKYCPKKPIVTMDDLKKTNTTLSKVGFISNKRF